LIRTVFNELPSEDFKEWIERLSNEASNWIDLTEFLAFMTIEGRPK
jgi:hypothetical protein